MEIGTKFEVNTTTAKVRAKIQPLECKNTHTYTTQQIYMCVYSTQYVCFKTSENVFKGCGFHSPRLGSCHSDDPNRLISIRNSLAVLLRNWEITAKKKQTIAVTPKSSIYVWATGKKYGKIIEDGIISEESSTDIKS